MVSNFIYNIFLVLYSVSIRLAAVFNIKARKWIIGRQQQNFNGVPKNVKTLWMHCASLGEFEQGRPVIEALKNHHPSLQIVLTFFSPSGFEACKNYQGANHIFYLPMDNFFVAKKFIDAINPQLVLWVKYEYWYYYLQELKRRNIPVLLISGIFRNNQPFFKWYGGIWKQMLQYFTHFFVQNESSKKLLNSIGIIENITISGDTRFDRVAAIAQTPLYDEIIARFCNNQKVIVAGSTWEDDEVILAAYADETHHEFKLIVVPHELDGEHLTEVKKMFKQHVCYSEVKKDNTLFNTVAAYKVLIVDVMGLLSRLYGEGFINYIGGGFTNDGIHNILEAAVWGKPIVIGENYEKYFEAIDLVKNAAAESISDTNELKEVINEWVNDADYYNESSEAAKKYVNENIGATKCIINYVQINRLLTN
jgi:3-deoxy-D-manno-octulosonic-acid transferase